VKPSSCGRRRTPEHEDDVGIEVDEPQLRQAMLLVASLLRADVEAPGRGRADLDSDVGQRLQGRVAGWFVSGTEPQEVGLIVVLVVEHDPEGEGRLAPARLCSRPLRKSQHQIELDALMDRSRRRHNDLTLDERRPALLRQVEELRHRQALRHRHRAVHRKALRSDRPYLR